MRSLFLFLLLLVKLCAATYQMTGATEAEFDAKYALTVTGDTIRFVQSGSATWSSSHTIGRAITIDGNGTTLTAGTPLDSGFFYITGFTSSALMRVTGFTFSLVDHALHGAAIDCGDGGLALTSFRVDHNTFSFGYNAMLAYGVMGVVDHNTFRNNLKSIDYSAGNNTQATASWVSMAAGTANALFVEDNTFVDDASYPNSGGVAFTQEKMGTQNGGKLVFRYNTYNCDAFPTNDNCEFIMTHGSAPGGVPANEGYWQQGFGARRGQSVVEIYNNTSHGKRIGFLCTLRGSANLVWGNSCTSTIGTPEVYLREEESTASWSPSRTTWPAEDQVHNSFFWSNTVNGVTVTGSDFVTGDIPAFIQENRDYFVHAPQSSGGSESFTGANGATNGYPTDGVLYPTLGTMTFSASGPNAYYGYTPYQYPNPLQGGGAGSSFSGGTLTVGGTATIK